MRIPAIVLAAMLGLAPVLGSVAMAGPAQEAVINHFAGIAKSSAFSAKRGKDVYFASPGTGKPETPSCTTCHTNAPQGRGRTRAGKPIEPLALSKTPDRYTDLAKVEKWFRRNCNSVLGRQCTAREKGDFLTFMIAQ